MLQAGEAVLEINVPETDGRIHGDTAAVMSVRKAFWTRRQAHPRPAAKIHMRKKTALTGIRTTERSRTCDMPAVTRSPCDLKRLVQPYAGCEANRAPQGPRCPPAGRDGVEFHPAGQA